MYSHEILMRVTGKVVEAMQELKEEDRSGFLFGIIMGPMLEAGWTKEQIKQELEKGLEQCWITENPVTPGLGYHGRPV